MQQYAAGSFGLNCDGLQVFFVCHPYYTDKSVLALLKETITGAEIVEPMSGSLAVDHAGSDFQWKNLGTPDDLTAAWVTDQSDFAILFGQSDQNTEFMMYCKTAGIPAIRIQSYGRMHSSWIEQLSEEDFEMKRLGSYISSLFPSTESIVRQADIDRSVFGYKLLWGGLYRRFMKKHTKNSAKDGAVAVAPQGISQCDFPADTRARAAFEALHKEYEAFDQTSIQYADQYWSAIYLRAVIPLITTIALSIGFYTESILSPWPVVFGGTSLQLWSVIAGLGFFAHALLNFYVFRLSQSRVISAWHRGYIDHRFIAEALRLSMHFEPFGIPINVKRFHQYGSALKPESDVYRRIRFAARRIAPVAFTNESHDKNLCLNRLHALIDDQILYHKKAVNRYQTIHERLERFAHVVFFLGFGFILLRGILQLLIGFHVFPANLAPQNLSMLKSFANMLALLIPTWATYFTLKLSLCNFRNLHADNASMLDNLKSIQLEIEAVQQKRNPTQEDLIRLSGHMASTILGEISQWYGQIESRKLTNL
jgi:hypothetical protein